ncbi:hypothetical protein [Streptomyces hoynatensis]|uniref:Uncharacterized protein n=1 Tax=Streptomyces hoynatensis TaxID=1141874 RepID=A0A3A9YQ99_9ACTN|nr:hypothetical protein [Streptomyces hoynatensis]RKN37487.1 hypothetical protein D7294_27495 [Streptomyces hoynatensis]
MDYGARSSPEWSADSDLFPPGGPERLDLAERDAVRQWSRVSEELGLPGYPGLPDIMGDSVARLPDRVAAMIEGGVAEPPDARVAGAVLMNLDEA